MPPVSAIGNGHAYGRRREEVAGEQSGGGGPAGSLRLLPFHILANPP